ncbi:hypothetical protein D9756_001741 [Leucocoprinus leucothites]|uniref:Uncharacterized protein n=1 Tax=Leucocoprinus leucothites TaxID=201217 RepID=A0A8H5LIA6_9AGAR|nr:hypothetical protein D9756_001741 [Leucoagaricus leucothites]
MRNFLRDTLLPLLVFPTLTYYAFKYTWGHLYASGLASDVFSDCEPGIGSYALPYTNTPAIDHRLCGLVAFFHEAMVPGDPITFLYYFIGVGSIFAVVPAVENYRDNRSAMMAFPVVFGLLSQVLSIGATTPLYYLFFFLSGGRARFDTATPITKAHVQAIAFGLMVGAAIPSICMVVMRDPIVTAIWQPYPIFMAAGTLLHLAIKRPNRAESGFNAIQLFYLISFIVASSLHLANFWPRSTDLEALKNLYIPSLIPLTDASTPAKAHEFLKWDCTFGLLSMGVAQLWFVSDLIEIPFILFWYLIAVPFFGPGAAVIAVNMWREGQIGDRLTISKEKEA